MDKDEALRLALEALETIERCEPSYSKIWSLKDNARLTITAIKAALEAKDEPVAWVNKERNTITWDKLYPDMDALYTTPPQRTWVGLTDKERREVWDSCERQTPTTYVKAIEAKLKEKNT
jgi:hypothetical protein